MPDIRALIDTYTPEQRTAALEILDACTRPLQVREIEGLLRLGGVSRSRAVKMAGTLKHMNLIAVIGPEQANG
ncbi:hypothetical protein [Qipengyuania spongiae]|uniref:Uncharacterized protein n=1 Tax=Qipengyuania spongiae TaxID=2909673 RepID=A0ABY5SYT1_9SPHN|nr:hypothetical protein [Qipengyuania spongiae]UVI39335.1 hypothetical protein L1F33_14080 [Qipengyuania spongiae]